MRPAHHRLSLAGKLGFTIGDYACNLYWQSISIFLLFFYTDAVGLSAATAGLIYMIASIVDAALDPVMGSIADRTRTKHGRYRPYILYGAAPLGAAFVLLYWRPPIEGLWLAAWMLASHIIFRVFYTALSIPYTSLNGRLTENSDERSTIAGLRMMFGTLAALTIAFTTQPMVAALGHGEAARGYAWAAVVIALIATAIFPLVYAFTREPPEEGAPPAEAGYRGYWRAIVANRAFWILMLSSCTAVACSTALGKSVLYYFKYYLRDEAASRYALSAMAASGLVVIPAWVMITKLIGKRNTWLTASALGLAGLAFFAATDIRAPLAMTLWLVGMTVSSLGTSFTFWSMLPDTVEYGEWAGGLRTESFIFGLGQFFLKAALGLGAGLFGWLLGQVGYVPNVAQTPATLAGLKLLMVVLPAAGLATGAVAMIFYPMGRGGHEAIVETLGARRLAEPATLNPEAAT